jgi:hypothetical protein
MWGYWHNHKIHQCQPTFRFVISRLKIPAPNYSSPQFSVTREPAKKRLFHEGLSVSQNDAGLVTKDYELLHNRHQLVQAFLICYNLRPPSGVHSNATTVYKVSGLAERDWVCIGPDTVF